MGSINKSHIEENGGVLLFNGELVLLYCDSVHCEIGGKESFKGRVYLTTHRLAVVISPFRQNAPVKSFCAPFCAITKCSVEQPIFGANYIEATVRDEADPTKFFSFKLKFSKGGAIELALAMNRAVQLVGRNYNPSMAPPPAYTPSPSAQYYQAPPTVYAPGYNSGIPIPTQQFPDQPPIGFIYASEAPPPYPGIGMPQQSQPPPMYPGQQQPSQTGGYPGQQPAQLQQQHQQQQPWVPNQGYPGQSTQQPSGYPGPQPAQQQQWGGYPQGPTPAAHQQGPISGNMYPGSQPQQSSAGYPDLGTSGLNQNAPNQQVQSGSSGNQAWPSAPSFNPNWQEQKKDA